MLVGSVSFENQQQQQSPIGANRLPVFFSYLKAALSAAAEVLHRAHYTRCHFPAVGSNNIDRRYLRRDAYIARLRARSRVNPDGAQNRE
jgi:hypothetical protein